MRACLCIGIRRELQQLKKKRRRKYGKACEQRLGRRQTSSVSLRGLYYALRPLHGGRQRRETKVFASGRNESRRKLNGKGREKWNNLPFSPRIALYATVLTYVLSASRSTRIRLSTTHTQQYTYKHTYDTCTGC